MNIDKPTQTDSYEPASLIMRKATARSVTLTADAQGYFGFGADAVLEFWDVDKSDWVTTTASGPIPVDVSQRSVFGRVKGAWGPQSFHLEHRLAVYANQAVFDDPWARDLSL